MDIFKENNVILRLKFEEKKILSLLDLSSSLYDFTLLYDCVILSTVKKYQQYKFSHFFWYRKGRPIDPEHMLYVKKISYKSPIMLKVSLPIVVAAVGIPWVLLQAIEKISNWKLNRKKLILEIENLQAMKKQNTLEKEKAKIDIETALLNRKSAEIFRKIIERIEKQNMPVADVEFYVEDKQKDSSKEISRKADDQD